MTFEMNAIPADKQRGWKVTMDGVEVKPGEIELSSKFGTLTYGLRPEGYDAWVFREQGGGGAVTLPYTKTPDGELLVGLILENRSNMGGDVWCVIGGFLDPGETHKTAQAREAAEEAALDAVEAKELPGLATNSNRAFFVTNTNEGEGVHAYGLSMPFTSLEMADDGYKLAGSATLPGGFKRGAAVRFFPWREAIKRTGDGLARAAIAQLLMVML